MQTWNVIMQCIIPPCFFIQKKLLKTICQLPNNGDILVSVERMALFHHKDVRHFDADGM